MNQSITIQSGVATLPTSIIPSDELMAKRLEQFETDLTEIELLQEKVKWLEGELAGADNLVELHRGYRRQIVSLEQQAVKQVDYVTELQAAGNQLGDDKEQLTAEVDRLTAQLNANTRVTDTSLQKQKTLETELKQLKKLDPERLAKKVKELQKTINQKSEDNAALRKQNSRLIADNKSKATAIEQLDKALDKACHEINEQNTPVPLDTINLGALGKWELYGSPQMNRYDILDKTNNVSFGVEVIDGDVILPEVRKVPKNLLKRIADRTARYHQTEAAIATAQQPLQTEQSKEV